MTFAVRGKRILVTGATGLIGGKVAARLLARGASVRALARTPEKARALAGSGAEVVRGDMTDAASLRAAVDGCRGVVHLAGVLGDEFKPLAYYRAVNVEGTRTLAEAAADAGVERFLHVSTIAVYGFGAGPGTNERSPHRPGSDFYCLTKDEGQGAVERLVRERGLPAVVVQPSQVYGPGDEAWTLGPLRLMRAGKLVLPAHGRGLVQPIYVDDLAEGILSALERGRTGEAFILCGAKSVTVAEFFGHLARMIGKTRIPSVPAWLAAAFASLSEAAARLTGRPPVFTRSAVRFITDFESTYDGAKARAELGFEPRTSLDEGMGAVRRWLEGDGAGWDS
jgi:nucleoside-diphosphate-sugar epimerase